MLNKPWDWWRRLRNRGVSDILLTLYEHGGVSLKDPTDHRLIALLSDGALHRWLGQASNRASVTALERELRKREAWAAPAGRAFWLSLASLAIATGSLIISVMRS